MRGLTLLGALYGAAIRAELQYRANFAFLLVLGMVYQSSGIAFVWVVLHSFGTVSGWTFGELALLYSMRVLAHACWVVPFHQVTFLDAAIREGRIDRYLVRPLNPLLQVITMRFRLNVLGDLAAGVALFVLAINLTDVHFSLLHIVYLLLAVAGGALAEGAAVLAVSALSFRFVETWAATYLVENVYLLFGSYPTRLFGAAVNWALTWVLPVAFVAYIPSSLLLGRNSVAPVLAWLAPTVGLAWFSAAYAGWRRAVRSYQGIGS